MTENEAEAFSQHFEYLRNHHTAGRLLLAGPTLGPHNTGIVVFTATDELDARSFMENDPAIIAGVARGELRPFRVSLLGHTPAAGE